MYNLYQDKSKPKTKQEPRPVSTTSTANSAKETKETKECNSNLRKEEWIKKNIGTNLAAQLADDPTTLHVSQYQYRDYTPYANIYTRQYTPEKQAVLINTLTYFKGHYIKEPYNSNSPAIQKVNWLRKQERSKELHHPIRFKAHSNHERIVSDIKKSPMSGEPLNIEIYKYPDWRKDQPDRFRTPVMNFSREDSTQGLEHHLQERKMRHGVVLRVST